MAEKVFMLEEAASKLMVEPQKVKDWLKTGWLVGEKIVTEWHISQSALIDFLNQHPTISLVGYGKGFSDGLGRNAKLYFPEAIAIDSLDNIYIADTKNHRIRKLNPKGELSTIAGSSESGYLDGLSSEAKFNSPSGIAVDKQGNLYISDTINHVIRKITPDGQVTTVAGIAGKKGCVDGDAKKAKFSRPEGLVVDEQGNFYIADFGNHRIRKIDPNGNVSTFAGSEEGYQDAVATEAKFKFPKGLALDSEGNLYVADMTNQRVRKITPEAEVTTIAGGGIDHRFDGSLEDVLAKQSFLYSPKAIIIDKNNDIYLSDYNSIKKISAVSGKMSILAGQNRGNYKDALGKDTLFYSPHGIAIDSQGSIYVADTDNSRIRKILTPGILNDKSKINIPVIEIPSALSTNKKEDDQLSISTLIKLSGYHISGLALDQLSNIYLFDGHKGVFQVSHNGEIKKITSNNYLCTPGQLIFFDQNNDLYYSLYGKFYKTAADNIDKIGKNEIGELLGETKRDIKASTMDAAGNIYFATNENKIYKLSTNKEITLLASSEMVAKEKYVEPFYVVPSMTVDKEGNLYVVDNNRIRKITSQGEITILVGNDYDFAHGMGGKTKLEEPLGLIHSPDNNLYLCDGYKHVIYKISLKGEVSWFAGRKKKGFTDGTLQDGQFDKPKYITVDKEGIFYIVDSKGLRIIKKNNQKLEPSQITSSQVTSIVNVISNLVAKKASEDKKVETQLPPTQIIAAKPIKKLSNPDFIMPRAEEFFYVYIDRNSPCGLVDRYDVMSSAAEKADIEIVLDILENSDDAGLVLAGILILSRILMRETNFSDQAQAILLKLMADPRIYEAKIDGFQQTVGMVGYLVNAPYYEIVKKKKTLEEKMSDILAGLYSIIKNPARSDMYYFALNAFAENTYSLSEKERNEKTKQIAQVFCELISDRTCPASERICSYEAIVWEIGRSRQTKEIFEQTRLKAANLLVDILLDTTEDERLRKYISDKLNNIAPHAITKLQNKGFLPTIDIPDITELIVYYDPDTEKLNRAACEVNASQVLEILQSPRNFSLTKLLTAIYLAPIVSRRFNWQAFAYALTNLINFYQKCEFKIKERKFLKEISKESSEQLAKILDEQAEANKEIVLELALKAFNFILDRGFSNQHYSDAAIWQIKAVFSKIKATEDINKFLMNTFLATWRSLAARFLAYRDLNTKESHEKAWEIILDSNEDPNLQALLGTMIYNYAKKEVENLVDISQTPWQIVPKAPKNLLISSPTKSVPECWLISVLNSVSDYEMLRIVINEIAERINLTEFYTKAEIEACRERVFDFIEKYPSLKTVTKKMCKKPAQGNVAINAVRIVTLLGESEDEEFIIDLILSGFFGWTKLAPFGNEWSGLSVLMSVLASDKIPDHVYSTFEPYLIVGFGEDKAKLMLSRVFVKQAQEYEQAGEKEKALRSYYWAISRDNNNLMAHQGLKKLAENK
ncbi:MAG: hypothetical protein J0M03_22410 [Acidobacteria bacterium]|nr:hypothetical protein [Acidobacteriota bacterium]